MIKINGKLQSPRRIFHPEWKVSRINTPLIKAKCNAFFARHGMNLCDDVRGLKSHARAEQRRKAAA